VSEYEIKALTSDTWDAFAALASRHGGAGMGGCWCTWFHRETHSGSPTGTAEDARDYKRGLVETGGAHAALVFDGDQAVGWAEYGSPDELPGIAHRKEYLEGADALPDYRITCFFVDRLSRRSGVAAAHSTVLSPSSPWPAVAWSRPTHRTPPARRCRQHSCTAAPAPCSNGPGSSTSARRERIIAFCGRSSTQAEKPSFKEAASARLTGQCRIWCATSRLCPAATSAFTDAFSWHSRCSKRTRRRIAVGGRPAFGFRGRRLFANAADIGRLELLSAVPTTSGSVLLGYRIT